MHNVKFSKYTLMQAIMELLDKIVLPKRYLLTETVD
jgi:hypothetical protein